MATPTPIEYTTVEFVRMQLKPDASLEEEGTAAYKTWQAITPLVGKADGLVKQYFGRQMEDPGVGVHVTIWSSPSAPAAFMKTPEYTRFTEGLDALTTGVLGTERLAPACGGYIHRTLGAPCSEVFTAVGCVADFEEQVFRFVRPLAEAAPEGYCGGVVFVGGEEGEGEGDGKVVRLVIGWESRERHLEAKGRKGPIQDNIGLLRTGRKSASMYHVQFKEL